MDPERRARLRRMMIDEAMHVVDEVYAADKRPDAAEARERVRLRFEAMDFGPTLRHLEKEGYTDDTATMYWIMVIRPALLKSVADLRPS